MQHGELVAEEGVLGYERRFAAGQIGEGTDRHGCHGGAGGWEQPPVEPMHGGAAERDKTVQQADRQRWLPPSWAVQYKRRRV